MYVIAEIASAHDGDYNIAKKIINSAINSGADAIKLQVFKRNFLLIKTNPYYENFGEVELTDDNWLKLIAKISKKNIDLIIEPYDLESFKLCESTGFIQSYKIPASSLNDRDLMSEVKITRVFSSIPHRFNVWRIRPTDQSISEITSPYIPCSLTP